MPSLSRGARRREGAFLVIAIKGLPVRVQSNTVQPACVRWGEQPQRICSRLECGTISDGVVKVSVLVCAVRTSYRLRASTRMPIEFDRDANRG